MWDAGTGGDGSELKLPPDDEEDVEPDDVEEVQRFKVAVRSGRMLEAHRQVLGLEEAGVNVDDVLDHATVEQVCRIAERYDYSRDMMKTKVSDLQIHEKNESLNLEWGCEVVGDLVRVVYVLNEPDLDIVRSFAAMQERDLQPAFNRGLVSAHPLGDQGAHDSLWRAYTISKTTNTKGDNVTFTSGVDALDEDDSSMLWTGQYTPTEAAARLHGVEIPAPEEGHARSEYSFVVCSMEPLVPKGRGDRTKGFRMKMLIEMKLPPVVSVVINVLPSWMIRRIARAKVEQGPRDFYEFVSKSPELAERMTKSPRADFYAQIRRHLLR